jgi:hypothetical protein
VSGARHRRQRADEGAVAVAACDQLGLEHRQQRASEQRFQPGPPRRAAAAIVSQAMIARCGGRPLVAGGQAPVKRNPREDLKSTVGTRRRTELATVQRDPLAHADKPVAGPLVVTAAACGSAARVANRQLELVGVDAHTHLSACRTGVLDRVGKSLLHEPVSDEVKGWRQRLWPAADAQSDR